MSTYSNYRPGYIEGKVKVGVYMDPDVRQTLKIRAAETGESMSDIVERAIRRELDMLTKEYEGWTIRTGFHAAELPGQGDDADQIDIERSGARYADMIREKIETEYPGATVEINYDTNAVGALPASMQTRVVDPESGEYRPGDGGEGGRIAEHVEDLCGQVWESWEWVVYKERETAAAKVAFQINEIRSDNRDVTVDAYNVAVDMGLDIDKDATEILVDLLPDSDPVAFSDGSFVRFVFDQNTYEASAETVAEYIEARKADEEDQ